MAAAREHLAKLKIGVNAAENGAFLPTGTTTVRDYALTAFPHSRTHTDTYRIEVSKAVLATKTKAQATQVLAGFASMLLGGNRPGGNPV